jgi:EAL domain-containing protein (putative c-di-GMP-specific phosphodiesterase class I)
VNFAAINLSGASLNDERFLQDAMAAIRRYPRSASRVCFEITESVALYDLKNTRRFVDRVRSFGSMVALDDFGAGYTSFNYLKELPADLVKIDGSFIRLLDTQPANYAITRAILDLSHQIGMSVVAEWVESVEVLEALMGLGIDYGQGFLLARPLSTETLVPARNSGSLVQDEAAITLLNDRRPPVFQRPNVLGRSEDIIPRER